MGLGGGHPGGRGGQILRVTNLLPPGQARFVKPWKRTARELSCLKWPE